jgi:hypothetical protein
LANALPLTSATVSAVAGSLSSLVDAAKLAATGGLLRNDTATESPVLALLSSVTALTDELASTLFGTLSIPGAAPVTITSPSIQIYLALDDATPGSSSRLFSAPISAPGSASQFDALPAGALGNVVGGVRTQFASFTFDPHVLDINSTGVTRLVFSNASGSELPVVSLSTPILFSMPRLPTLADGFKAQCQFWDTAAQNYSTVGCVSMPDPRPAGHAFAWAPGYTVSSDTDMVRAWNVSGPLLAGCSVRVLDCTQQAPGVVFPNPAQPFAFPAISCDANVSTAPMRVFLGSKCALIQPDNAYRCAWDNTKQVPAAARMPARMLAAQRLTRRLRRPSPAPAAWPVAGQCSAPAATSQILRVATSPACPWPACQTWFRSTQRTS